MGQALTLSLLRIVRIDRGENLLQLLQALFVLLFHRLRGYASREGACKAFTEVTANTTAPKCVPFEVAFDVVDSGRGHQRSIGGLVGRDVQLTLLLKVVNGRGFVAIAITCVGCCHGVLSFVQVELHGALPLRRVPRIGGGWMNASVLVDVTHLHGSVRLEAVFV